MKKLLVLSLLLAITIHCKARETVRIDFFPGAPEEFDIFFKKGFESIGNTVFINYFNRLESKPYDLLLKYEWVDNTLKVSLYNKTGELLKQSEKKFIYLDKIETITYLFMGEFLDRRLNVKDRRGRLKGANAITLSKLDSAVYVILAYSNDSADVKEMFLQAGNKLTGNFRAYYEISKYQCESVSVIGYTAIITAYFRSRIMGIVIGDKIEGQNYLILDEPPEIYKTYISDLIKDVQLRADNLGDSSISRIYIMRNTGHIAGAIPFDIYIDGTRECYLYDKKYAVFKLSPGKHEIVVQDKGKSLDPEVIPFKVEAVPSKNIYVSVLLDSNNGILCQEEKEHVAKLLIRNFARDDCKIGN